MQHKTFKFYSDPGHGWLAVKRAHLVSLGIIDQITGFSYQRGKTVYLEEDCDVGTFFAAFKQAYGHEPRTIEGSFTNNSSPIRSYEHFRVA